MCGIVGAIEKIDGVLDFNKNCVMHGYIANRGPDNYALDIQLLSSWKISLAHSRLSIIDISELSNQPMLSERSELIIVFNGEIYNYLEIRSELQAMGVVFKSTGDTEVLLKAWELWGEKCLSKFNGMFAFALLDKREKSLFLVRDRFGVKPLLYGISDSGELVFSSSISAVASVLKNGLNFDYVSRGLRFGFFEGNDEFSPYRGVEYVRAGSIVKILLGTKLSLQKKSWYDLESEVNKKIGFLNQLEPNEIAEHCSSIIEDATRLRLRSDVPLAVSLSGGVDSSIVATLSKKYTDNLVAFSYGAPLNLKSEGPLVARFSKSLNIKVKYIHPNYEANDLGNLLDNATLAQEAPFYGLSILAQHEVYRRVREEGFKVLLGGQGADEAFAGYRKYFVIACKESWHTSNYVSALNLLLQLGSMLLYERRNYWTYWSAKGRYLNREGNDFRILNGMPTSSEELFGNISFRERQIADILKFSLPSLLRYEDRNSMYYSIESRLPFMDFRVIEFGVALNKMLKIRNGFGKWILRESFNGAVPDFILRNRVKRGFDVTQNWVAEGVGARLISNITSHKSKLRAYVRDEKVFYKDLSVDRLVYDPQFLNECMILNFICMSKYS